MNELYILMLITNFNLNCKTENVFAVTEQ